MANILGIFTAIILAVAAFVAVKNNARLEEEIANRTTEQSQLATSQKRLGDTEAVLEALPVEIADIEAQFASKTEEETALKTSVEELRDQIDAKTQQIASNKQRLDEIREKTAQVGELKQLESKMKTMRIELEELEQSIASNEASLANLTEQNTETQAEVDRRKEELDIVSKGSSLPSLNTRIRNIYPTWGFVTLRDGNNAGVTANSKLEVIRDGQVVAELLVTAVESRSASASIIPDSVAEDVTLMVGDRVIAATKDSDDAKTPADN